MENKNEKVDTMMGPQDQGPPGSHGPAIIERSQERTAE